MGHSPERKPIKTQIQTKRTMQRNLHHLDYFEEFSPLLTSTNKLMIIAKEKTTPRNIQPQTVG